ncbi:hypothetical protein ACLB2K_024298 [Fragaria x ananassa]
MSDPAAAMYEYHHDILLHTQHPHRHLLLQQQQQQNSSPATPQVVVPRPPPPPSRPTKSRSASSKPVRVFPCLFCPRKFSTFHALGGHLNVHKRQREAALRNRASPGGAAYFQPSPSPSPEASFQHHLGPHFDHQEYYYSTSHPLPHAASPSFPTPTPTTTSTGTSTDSYYYSAHGGQPDLDLTLRL